MFNLIYLQQDFGPIIVDTTPPELRSIVTLEMRGDSLVAQINLQDVIDPEDPNLELQISIGNQKQLLFCLYRFI